MKAIILVETENSRSSAVIFDHSFMSEVEPFRKKLEERPEVHRATILAAGLTGRTVFKEPNDSIATIAQIAAW